MTPSEVALKKHARIRLVTFALVLTSLFALVAWVDNLLASLLVAFVVSYLLGPIVNRLERRGVDRVLGSTLVFVLIGVILTLLAAILTPTIGRQLAELQINTPGYVKRLSESFSNLESKVAFQSEFFDFDVGNQLTEHLLPVTQNFFSQLPGILQRTLTVMLLGPFLAFFLLKDGRQFSRSILNLVPNSIFEVTYSIFHQINDQLGQFIRARLMESAIIGMITGLGLLIIGFPFAFLLAGFAAVTNLIPYIGPLIGLLPALAVALVQGLTGIEIGMVLLVYFVAQLIDTAFIIPVVVAKIVDLHPVAVIVVIIIGAQFMGVLGMLISIPLASAIKVTFGTIFRHLTDHRH